MQISRSKLTKCLLASIAVLAMLLMLFGCSGSDGAAGAPGATGATGSNTGTITGTVMAPDGVTPMAAVTVSNNLSATTATTDSAGKFSIALPIGTYTLSFAKSGFTTGTATVNVAAAGATSSVAAVALAEAASGLPTVTLASDKNEVGFGNTVNLTATVTPGANSSALTYAWKITPPSAGSAQGLGKITAGTDPKTAVVTMPVMHDATTFRGAFDGTVTTIAGQIYQTQPVDDTPATDLTGKAAPAGTIVPADPNFVAPFVPQFYRAGTTVGVVPMVVPITADTRGAVTPSLTVTDSLGGKVTVGMPATQPLYAAAVQPGVNDVPVGEPVYLSSGRVPVPPATVPTPAWAWTLTAPAGSKATLSSATAQYPFFVPDVAGKYTVKDGANTTLIFAGTFAGAIENGTYITKSFNLNDPLQAEMSGMWYDTTNTAYWAAGATSATYTKWPAVTPAGTCTVCHANNVVVLGLTAPDMFTPWKDTAHANFFARGLEGITSNSGTCLTCHTVGYDLSMGAINGGFDNVAAANGWTYPATRVAGNWATMWASAGSAAVAKLSNIQCESCHGPQNTTDAGGSSGHISGVAGSTQVDGTKVAGGTRVNFSAEVCAVCHASGTGHHFYSEWLTESGDDPNPDKGHANLDLAQAHPTCGCHSAQAFVQYIPSLQAGTVEYDVATFNPTAAVNITAANAQPQTCTACHDPHGAPNKALSTGQNPNQLRVFDTTPVLGSGFSVAGMGKGAICIVCHNARSAQQCNGTVIASEPLTGITPAAGPVPFGATTGTNPTINACIVATAGNTTRSQTLTFLHEDNDPYMQANPVYSGVHDATQADVLMGRNAFFMGNGLPMISKHAAVKDSCVGCHMSLNPQTHLSHGAPAVSSHTFAITDSNQDKLCANCHGNGSVSADGIQANVKALQTALRNAECNYVMTRINNAITAGNAPYWRSGSGTAAAPYVYTPFTTVGSVTTTNGTSFTIKNMLGVTQGATATATFSSTSVYARGAAVTLFFNTTFSPTNIVNKLYRANQNYNLIVRDYSFGIHNPSFVIGVLNNTIAAMKDTSN